MSHGTAFENLLVSQEGLLQVVIMTNIFYGFCMQYRIHLLEILRDIK
jgi:hypothetical protein